MLKASPMCRLSVNVNKLATLRNSRGKNNPDVAQMALQILALGAHGLTVHPRPDGRHIRVTDVEQLHAVVDAWNKSHPAAVEFNIEGYPSDDFLELLRDFPPHQATLVPDPPDTLTSNAGWALEKNQTFLSDVVGKIHKLGIRVSLFVDPFTFTKGEETALAAIRPDRIELYTESFADHFATAKQMAITKTYRDTAEKARALGIGVNAGHDLNQKNLGFLVSEIPWLEEVSIGHALICEALSEGMSTTVRRYLKILEGTRNDDLHAPRS